MLKFLLVSLAFHVLLLSLLWPTPLRPMEFPGRAAGTLMRVSLASQVAQEISIPVDDGRGKSEVLSKQAEIARQSAAVERSSTPSGELPSVRHLSSEMVSTNSKIPAGAVGERPPAQAAIDQYRLNLARATRQFRQYPVAADSAGLEGRVVVVVNTVAGMGRPRVSLSQSSGSEILDALAVSMVDQAVFVTELPAGLLGGVFALTLPIHFSLSDAGN